MDRLGGLDDSSLALLFAAALTAFLCGLALLRQSRRRAERRASERTMLAREAHLFRQAQQAVSMKRAITAITEALNDDARLPEMLQACADAIVTHLDGGLARIWMLDTAPQTLVLRAGAGVCAPLDRRHARVAIGLYTIGFIAEMRKPVLAAPAAVDLPFGDPGWAQREALVAFAGYPLMAGRRLVGVLALFSPRDLSAPALDALAVAANAMALAIDHTRVAAEPARSVEQLRPRERRALPSLTPSADGQLSFETVQA